MYLLLKRSLKSGLANQLCDAKEILQELVILMRLLYYVLNSRKRRPPNFSFS